MISHSQEATFTGEDGKEYTRTTSTLSKQAKSVVHPMADVIGYAKAVEINGENKVMLHLRATPQFDAGSRFKYVPDSIELTYQNLVDVIAEAVEKEEQAKGQTTVIEKGENLYTDETLSYDDLVKEMKELSAKVSEKIGKDEAKNLIKELFETHLGKGRTIKDLTTDHVEQLSLIVYDLKEKLV